MGKAKTEDIARRNARIVRQYTRAGETLQEIGDQWGISRERVRQILVAEGINVGVFLRARLETKRHLREVEELRNAPPATVCPVCLGPSFRRPPTRTCSPECSEVWAHVRYTIDETARIHHRRSCARANLAAGRVAPGQIPRQRAVAEGRAIPANRGPYGGRWETRMMELRARREVRGTS